MQQIQIKQFEGEPLSLAECIAIEEVIQASEIQADEIPFHFVFVRNLAMIQSLESLIDKKGWMKEAKTVLIGFADPTKEGFLKDTYQAFFHAQEKIHALGYESDFISDITSVFSLEHTELKEQLSIPSHYLCIDALAIGKASIQTKQIKQKTQFTYIQ